MITFLLVVHAIIAALLVGVILMQKSEGGGLGMGGGPAGLMSARGAADFLTRATAILATLFVLMAFFIAAIASHRDSTAKIDTSLAHQAPVGPITAPATGGSPLPGIPMAGQPIAGPPPTGIPTVPDPATAQALQPASAGLPAAAPAKAPSAADLKAQAAAARADAAKIRRTAPTAANLKTIDTSKAAGNASIGIEGVSNGAVRNSATPRATTAAPSSSSPSSTFSIAPKAAPVIPPVAVPPAPASNSSTPQ